MELISNSKSNYDICYLILLTPIEYITFVLEPFTHHTAFKGYTVFLYKYFMTKMFFFLIQTPKTVIFHLQFHCAPRLPKHRFRPQSPTDHRTNLINSKCNKLSVEPALPSEKQNNCTPYTVFYTFTWPCSGSRSSLLVQSADCTSCTVGGDQVNAL